MTLYDSSNFGTLSGSTAVSFGGGADVLVLGSASVLSGRLAGFGVLDTIDLAGVQADRAVFTGTTLNGTLTVYNGLSTVRTLGMIGRFAPSGFAVAS